MQALCQEFANDSRPTDSRQLAGLYMKNMITAKDEALKEEKTQMWSACPPMDKQQIRMYFLQALQSPIERVRHTAAQVLAAFGAVDVPQGQWPELVPLLVQNVTKPTVSEGIRIASLEVSHIILQFCIDLRFKKKHPL